jgi:integrase/recombinase XerD
VGERGKTPRKPFVSYTLKALGPTDYKKLLRAVSTLEDEVLIRLAVSNGLRRKDIAKIKIANIDLEHNRLTYHEHKKNRDRTVPISPALVQLIKKYLFTIDQKSNKGYLFSFGKSTYGDRTAYNRFARLCELAGIDRRPFHALRGTCVKFKQREGWTPAQVAVLIGDEIETVQKHYETPSTADLAELMGREEEFEE